MGACFLEPNKRGCNKRGCMSKNNGNEQHWPNLREVCQICAKFAKCAGNNRGCKSIVFAKFAQIYGPLCYGTCCSCQMFPYLPPQERVLRHHGEDVAVDRRLLPFVGVPAAEQKAVASAPYPPSRYRVYEPNYIYGHNLLGI